MEDYLQSMRTLRSQMNDVEDESAKISVEEQMLISTIQTTENDLLSAKADTEKLDDKINEMVKEKGQICSQILDKQRKIASLESDSSALLQTLELMQQEGIGLSAKLVEKRTYYAKVSKDLNAKLQEQQEWLNSREIHKAEEDHKQVRYSLEGQSALNGGKNSNRNISGPDCLDSEARNLTIELESAKAKLLQVAEIKLELVSEINKMKVTAEQVKSQIDGSNSELGELDIKALEDEYKALLSDKAGETEYLHSLQKQMDKLKEISHMIKCGCGEEYKLQLPNL